MHRTPLPNPWQGWRVYLANAYADMLFHYVLVAGVAFLVCYVIGRGVLNRKKIQAVFPPISDVTREILYSLASIGIFAMVGFAVVMLRRTGHTLIYSRFEKYGLGYYLFSVVGVIFLHDAWFYWTHRLMHWRPLFRLVHHVHHRSHNPTPWAAYSFHPLEAVMESGFIGAAVFVIPLHPLAILVWLLYMITMNVLGHLGFEFLPAGFSRHWLFRWQNTSVHHNMHHRYYSCNYGLYFNIWDRLMGTNHAHYDDHFDQVAGASRKSNATVTPTLIEEGAPSTLH
jgi:lathosterol oxidase